MNWISGNWSYIFEYGTCCFLDSFSDLIFRKEFHQEVEKIFCGWCGLEVWKNQFIDNPTLTAIPVSLDFYRKADFQFTFFRAVLSLQRHIKKVEGTFQSDSSGERCHNLLKKHESHFTTRFLQLPSNSLSCFMCFNEY